MRDGNLVKTLHVDPAPPLGLGRSADPTGPADPLTIGTEQLEPGDRVLFYTDGVTEARSPDGDFFGPERLVDLISRNLASGLPTPETMRRVVRALLGAWVRKGQPAESGRRVRRRRAWGRAAAGLL